MYLPGTTLLILWYLPPTTFGYLVSIPYLCKNKNCMADILIRVPEEIAVTLGNKEGESLESILERVGGTIGIHTEPLFSGSNELEVITSKNFLIVEILELSFVMGNYGINTQDLFRLLSLSSYIDREGPFNHLGFNSFSSLSKKDCAGIVGLGRDAFSRFFKRMKDKGLLDYFGDEAVRVGGKRVIVINPYLFRRRRTVHKVITNHFSNRLKNLGKVK